MTNIVFFRPRPVRAVAKPHPGPAAIIIFPGIRYVREAAEAVAAAGPRQPKTPVKTTP